MPGDGRQTMKIKEINLPFNCCREKFNNRSLSWLIFWINLDFSSLANLSHCRKRYTVILAIQPCLGGGFPHAFPSVTETVK